MTFYKYLNLTPNKNMNTEQNILRCDLCLKEFNSSSAITTHKRKHSGENPFQCCLCQKAFSISANLTVHKHSHSGEAIQMLPMSKVI